MAGLVLQSSFFSSRSSSYYPLRPRKNPARPYISAHFGTSHLSGPGIIIHFHLQHKISFSIWWHRTIASFPALISLTTSRTNSWHYYKTFLKDKQVHTSTMRCSGFLGSFLLTGVSDLIVDVKQRFGPRLLWFSPGPGHSLRSPPIWHVTVDFCAARPLILIYLTFRCRRLPY